ncbi:MAG TPA: S53 family peptidase [Ktedonobacteraceae bacterium]|jgi:subtilase family serine protease|nr:S53 family peptidase [Ktedonobacteraceae bacterium]
MKHAAFCKAQLYCTIPVVTLMLLTCLLLPSSITHAHSLSPSLSHGTLARPYARTYSLLSQKAVPPTDAGCRAKSHTPCYSPQEMRTIYGLNPLLNAGYDGAGQTIVIIDSFGSPTLAHDLYAFDQGYGLPDPPSLQIYAPLGSVPFDSSNSDQTGWAFETTLDVEWAHAMAPRANIVVLTSPVSETEGVQGMPEFLKLEQYALKRHIGSIISQSWGATENTLFSPAGKAILNAYDSFYKQAASQHVTVLASSGDAGVLNQDEKGKIYPSPTVIFPASSPWVTAVGGTSLYASTRGHYISESVWNNSRSEASGGGISQYFAEPAYQKSSLNSAPLRNLLHGQRAIPDIAYNANPSTSILIYLSFFGQKQAGYYTIGGTSEGAPQWAGIVAIANQKAGRPLGFLNNALYQIGRCACPRNAYHDITHGGNGSGNQPGYPARVGWDAATGWGTPNASVLVPALIRLLS